MDKGIRRILSFFLIILGALMASFSVVCILIPNDAIDYGTAGIGIIISKLTGANLSVCVAVAFLPFLVLGASILGKRFTLKALLGTVVYTLGLDFFEKIPFELNTEHFLAVVFGGAILGAGLALILKSGGCIDGSEIFANVIVKKLSDLTGRNFSMTYILIGFNVCVYLAVFFLLDRNAALLSLLVYIIATSVINNLTDHYDAVKEVKIITKHPSEIVQAIKENLNKTCTILDSHGAIAGDNKTVICYVNYFELQKVIEIISKNNDSFSVVSTVDKIIN